MMALIRVRALEIAFSPVMWTQRNLMMIILLLVPTVLFASMLSASCYAQAPLQHVVLTYSSRSIASIDLFIAQERGFFATKDSMRSSSRFEPRLQSPRSFQERLTRSVLSGAPSERFRAARRSRC
jgi:hypothetical protein